MATLRTVYTTGVSGTYLRAMNSSGQFWYTVTPAFEAFNASHLSSYQIALTENSSSGVYEATTPASWPAGSYTLLYFDPASSSDPLAVFSYDWDGDSEVTLNALNDGALSIQAQIVTSYNSTNNNITQSIDDLQSHGDDNWQGEGASVTILPISTVVGTGEVKDKRIVLYQHAAFDSKSFTVTDSAGNPVDCSGIDVAFVAYDRTTEGTYLWQIDGATISGTYSNIVTVEDDDTNTGTAGSFRYVLRDLTNDRVLAIGDLEIRVAADAV